MKIGTGWTKNVQDKDVAELLALITSGDQEVDEKTGLMIEQYKDWTNDLTEGELVEVIKLLGRGKDLGRHIAGELELELKDRRNPELQAKREKALQMRRDALAATEKRLLRLGLEALGGDGDTWDGRRAQIDVWWREVKRAEGADTWAAAFAENRMTARQVNTNSVLGGEIEVRNIHDRRDRAWDRKIQLNRTLEGVRARIKPANFNDPKTTHSHKNELGLHDLSASLLDGTRDPMTINSQLKPYAAATVVFMPVPTERNAQIFHAIRTLTPVTDADRKLLREIRSSFTRLRLAQATDMHTYLLNVNEERDGEPKVRYGRSGRIRRPGEKAEVRADEIDIATRRMNALQHTTIVGPGTDQVVNEVVMVYREHASAVFPVFAVWDQLRTWFVVLNRDTNARTTTHITNAGKWVG